LDNKFVINTRVKNNFIEFIILGLVIAKLTKFAFYIPIEYLEMSLFYEIFNKKQGRKNAGLV